MTVEEAKEQLLHDCHMLQIDLGIPHDLLEEFDYAIQALEEVEQYRALGTVEELKEAREKQVAKNIVVRGQGYEADCLCPNCGICLGIDADIVYDQTKYCHNCGQALEKY